MPAPRASLGAAADALIAGLRGCPVALHDFNDNQLGDLFGLAREQRLSALLYRRGFASTSLDAETQNRIAPLQRMARDAVLLGLQHRRELTQLAHAYADAGTRCVLLKGAALAGSAYPEFTLREMHDLDLLVHPEDVPHAITRMQALGYRLSRAFDPDTCVPFQHHAPPLIKGPIIIEIHWTLSPVGFRFDLDPDEIWSRAVPAVDLPVLMPCPEDLLLHVCTHAAYQHFFELGLRSLCDVTALVSSTPSLDWDAVVERAQRWGCARGVFLTLRLAADELDAAVPEAALAALQPADFDRAIMPVALMHAFTPSTFRHQVTRGGTLLYTEKSVVRRFAFAASRLFVSRAELASIFPKAAHSRFPARYYVARASDLFRRYAGHLLRGTLRIERQTEAFAHRRHSVYQWLHSV